MIVRVGYGGPRTSQEHAFVAVGPPRLPDDVSQDAWTACVQLLASLRRSKPGLQVVLHTLFDGIRVIAQPSIGI